MPEPSLDDQRSDLQRLIDACGAEGHALGLRPARRPCPPSYVRPAPTAGAATGTATCAASAMHGETLVGYATSMRHTPLSWTSAPPPSPPCSDTARRHVVAARGEHNAQSPYGADVISRIRHETEWKNTATARTRAATGHRQQDFRNARRAAGTGRIGDVDFLSLTGNTTMMHLLCGLPGEHIGKAPFIPATLEPMRLPPPIWASPRKPPAFLLPGISAYIGADIVAFAPRRRRPPQPAALPARGSGTNAETVLCANGMFYACSAAAGPCFEGATLSCGMAGQDGAIDTVSPDPETRPVLYHHRRRAPRGLCGSGAGCAGPAA